MTFNLQERQWGPCTQFGYQCSIYEIIPSLSSWDTVVCCQGDLYWPQMTSDLHQLVFLNVVLSNEIMINDWREVRLWESDDRPPHSVEFSEQLHQLQALCEQGGTCKTITLASDFYLLQAASVCAHIYNGNVIKQCSLENNRSFTPILTPSPLKQNILS